MKSGIALKLLEFQVQKLNEGLKKTYWTIAQNDSSSSLVGNYTFKTFAKTWEFLNSVAIHANKERHHPTITTTYNKVQIELTTHDAGNVVTQKDTKLAAIIQDTFRNKFTSKVNTARSLVNDARDEVVISKAKSTVNDFLKQ